MIIPVKDAVPSTRVVEEMVKNNWVEGMLWRYNL